MRGKPVLAVERHGRRVGGELGFHLGDGFAVVADALEALHQGGVLLGFVHRGLHGLHLVHRERVALERAGAGRVEIAAGQSRLGDKQGKSRTRDADEGFHKGAPNRLRPD